MNRRILVGLVLGLGAVVSCDGGMPDPANSTPVQQLEFDLTINQDRALFKEDGLEYQGSVGPYAVYKVTKQNPRLIGPYIDTRGKMVGYAMLCGANHYFTRDFNASAATMQLLGGHSGLETFVESEQQAMSDGNCTPPKDQFGSPIPDGGDSSGGSNGGGTNGGGGGGGGGGGTGGGTGGCNSPDGCPNGGGTTGGIGGTGGTGGSGSPGGSTGGGTGGSTGAGGSGGGTGGAGGCTSPDPNGCTNGGSTAGGGTGGGGSSGGDNSGGNVLIQRLNVSFGYAAPPRIGSTVLLRRVALTGARRHNGSHIIPNICCGGGQCTLGAVQ